MKISSLVRWIATALSAVALIPISQNLETVSQRLGWDTAIADIAVPKSGPSLMIDAVTSPPAVMLLMIAAGIAVGMWLDTALRAWDRRRDAQQWWKGLHTFSVRSGACLIAGIPDTEFDKSARAKAIADEYRGYINAGHMPTVLEARLPVPVGRIDYRPPYATKTIGYDAVILRRDLENLARARGWQLPWSIPPKPEKAAAEVQPVGGYINRLLNQPGTKDANDG